MLFVSSMAPTPRQEPKYFYFELAALTLDKHYKDLATYNIATIAYGAYVAAVYLGFCPSPLADLC